MAIPYFVELYINKDNKEHDNCFDLCNFILKTKGMIVLFFSIHLYSKDFFTTCHQPHRDIITWMIPSSIMTSLSGSVGWAKLFEHAVEISSTKRKN